MVKQFSNIISELRRERGISQKQAAEELGVSQALLSHYENGLREPKFDFVVKICEYYGVSTDYLLGRTEIRNNPAASAEAAYITETGSSSIWENESVSRLFESITTVLVSVAATGQEELTDNVCRCIELTMYKLLRKLMLSYEMKNGELMRLPVREYEAVCDIAEKTAELEFTKLSAKWLQENEVPAQLRERILTWAHITDGLLADSFEKGE